MHLCTHSCFNHFQTYQIYNTKKCVDMCAMDGRGAIENLLVRKGGASQNKIGKHCSKASYSSQEYNQIWAKI